MSIAATYQELPLQHLDARRIEALWRFAPRQAGVHRVLPDGRIDLLVRFDLHARDAISNIRLIIAGPAQRYTTLPTERDTALLGVRFRAGWGGACLAIRPAEIRDLVLLGDDATQVLGAHALPLLAARTITQLENALIAVAHTLVAEAMHSTAQQRAIAAIDLLHFSGGRLAVSALALAVNTSERTLRRDIMDSVGLSVKALSSILRFQRTLRLLHTHPGLALPQLALEGGYSDQAHMTREFRELGGFTPGMRPEVALLNLSLDLSI